MDKEKKRKSKGMFCDCTDLEIRGFRCSPERMDVCIPEHLEPGILTSIQAELLPMCVLPQVSQWQTFCKFKMHRHIYRPSPAVVNKISHPTLFLTPYRTERRDGHVK